MSLTSISGRHGVPSESTETSPAGERAGDKIVEHEVEPQAPAHAAGGRKSQAGNCHAGGVHAREAAFGRDLGAGIGGQRINLVIFPPRAALGETINRARRGKDKGAHASLSREPGETQARLRIDLVGDLLEPVSHRVVRHRRQMNNSVDPVE